MTNMDFHSVSSSYLVFSWAPAIVYTVEPLIKDPLRRGQPLYKGHFQYPQECIWQAICNTF